MTYANAGIEYMRSWKIGVDKSGVLVYNEYIMNWRENKEAPSLWKGYSIAET